jgi:putative zinc finger protein
MVAVTCAEMRDLFSARADDALAAGERARLDAHLIACAECAAEWRRFEGTVGLLRAVPPARAPAGFVDRVLAARPRPWYRRLARSAFVPWPVKLPLEAAAIVLVAGLAILIVQGSPELQQAARTPAPPAAVTAPPQYAAPPDEPSPDAGEAAARRELEAALRDARSPRKTESARREPTAAHDAVRPAEAPPMAAESRAKSAQAPERGGRTEADGAGGRSAPPSAPALEKSSGVQARSAPLSLRGRLAVEDRAAAERAVGELVTRAGGRLASRVEEPEAIVLDLVVPDDRWDEVRRGLAALGALRLEGERGRAAGGLALKLRLER